MARQPKQVLRRAPSEGAAGARISPKRYDALRRAILFAVPKDADGILLADLTRAVAPRVPKALFRDASLRWYVTAVKLDLEAQGLIERSPGRRPQRLRQVVKKRPPRPRRY
jgi:hypothetical protein